MVRCPNGHDSTDDDYCSVCGVAIVAASAPAVVPPSAGGTGGAAAAVISGGARGNSAAIAPMLTNCPDCSTVRSDMSARYCEVCRYDFEMLESHDAATAAAPPAVGSTSAASVVPPSVAQTMSPPTAPPTAMPYSAPPTMHSATTDPAPDPAPAAFAGPVWEVRVSVDAALDTEPDPDLPPPTDEPDYFFPLTQDETLIGRRDERQQIRPHIPLRDPGVSRRHAMLRRDADGVSIMDLDSTNGTAVNGDVLPPNSRRVLKSGDEITIGRWTRMALRGDV